MRHRQAEPEALRNGIGRQYRCCAERIRLPPAVPGMRTRYPSRIPGSVSVRRTAADLPQTADLPPTAGCRRTPVLSARIGRLPRCSLFWPRYAAKSCKCPEMLQNCTNMLPCCVPVPGELLRPADPAGFFLPVRRSCSRCQSTQWGPVLLCRWKQIPSGQFHNADGRKIPREKHRIHCGTVS